MDRPPAKRRAATRVGTARALVVVLVALTRGTSARPCVPKTGKTLLVVGQDVDSIASYADTFGAPAGLSAYTDVVTLGGVRARADHGGGVQDVDDLVRTYPGASLLLAVWAVGELRNVTAGVHDRSIDELADWIRDAGVPVYVRFGYEFDNPGNAYDPTEFISAYRRFVTRVRARGVPNVAFAWHSWGFAPADDRPIGEWFPGAAFVDWVGVSAFQQMFEGYGGTGHMDRVADFAAIRRLPLMIAEATPFGGLHSPSARDVPGNAHAGAGVHNGTALAADTWASWFEPLLTWIEARDVRLFAYIDCNWSAQPMWTGGGWGDTRLEADARHRALWRQRVLGDKRFQSQPGPIGCEPGTSIEPSAPAGSPSTDPRGAQLTPRQTHGRRILLAFAVGGAVCLTALFVSTNRLLRRTLPQGGLRSSPKQGAPGASSVRTALLRQPSQPSIPEAPEDEAEHAVPVA